MYIIDFLDLEALIKGVSYYAVTHQQKDKSVGNGSMRFPGSIAEVGAVSVGIFTVVS